MWVVIILFLYATFNNIKAFHGLDQERRNEYVIRRFREISANSTPRSLMRTSQSDSWRRLSTR
jgi:hypothetical protein